jgi:hypothetical protein
MFGLGNFAKIQIIFVAWLLLDEFSYSFDKKY